MQKILIFYNFFDSALFVSLLVIFIWVGCSWRWGARLSILLATNGFINYFCKDAFAFPRPRFYDPTLLPLAKAHGFGFPSGGAQNALLIGGVLFYYAKNRWVKGLAIFFALSVSFSRIYLGVHFPLDVVGGTFLGFLMLSAFITLLEPIERAARRAPFRTACLVLISGGALLLYPSPKSRFLALTIMTNVVGIFFSNRHQLYFPPPHDWEKSLLLGLFGILSSLCVALLIHALPVHGEVALSLQTITIGLWISLAISPICKVLFFRN